MTREFVIALLQDEHGINGDAYHILESILRDIGGYEDILRAVSASEGRFYLPEEVFAHR